MYAGAYNSPPIELLLTSNHLKLASCPSSLGSSPAKVETPAKRTNACMLEAYTIRASQKPIGAVVSLSNTENELPLIPTSKAADPQFQIPLSAFGALVFENGPLLGDVPAKLKTATFGMQVTIDSHREAATATTFTNRCIRRTVRWCRFDHPQREGCLLRAHRRAREVARARAVRWRRRAAHVRGHVQRRPRERRWRPRDAERQVRS